MVAVMPGIAPSRTPPFRLFPCRKKPIFMHLQHRQSVPVPFRSLLFSPFISPFYGTVGFLQQFVIFSRKRPKAAYPKYAVLEAEL